MKAVDKLNKWLYKFYKWRYRHVSEETYMAILSVVIGVIGGLVAVTIKNLTHLIEAGIDMILSRDLYVVLYFILPVIGIGITVLIVKKVIRKPVDDGIPVILYSIMKLKSFIPAYHTFASLITAPITVGFGGSVGLEGPSALTGAAIGSNVAKRLHLNLRQRNLLIAAATAGTFSSIFKAPVAGIMFVIEVLSFDLTLTSMVPLILASVSGVLTSYFFLGKNILLHFELHHSFTFSEIPLYILLGLTSATTSLYFLKTYEKISGFFSRIHSSVKRWAIGGVVMGLLLIFLPALYGEGYDIINHLLLGNYHYIVNKFVFSIDHNNVRLVILVFVLLVTFKVVAMTVTFASGGIGGVFAPTLFTGAISGYVFGLIFNYLGILPFELSLENYALVGMAGSIAGVVQAPLMAVFLIVEITGGQELMVPVMIVATLSYLITKRFRKYSIYTMQLINKSPLPSHNKDYFAGVMIELDSVIEKDFLPVTPDMTLGEMLMNAVTNSHRNLFPVLDESKHFIGVVTLDDIRHIMFNKSLYDKIHMRDLMHRAPAVIIYQKDDFQKTMHLFQSTGAWNLPVIKEDGTYVGFISKSKLLSVYRKKLLELTYE